MDALLILFLILLNGAFAMSELALASSRKARLLALAESGDRGAQTALNLMDNPTQFLSSVQVGITSIGMLNGIVGEAAFSNTLARALHDWGLSTGAAGITATAVVVTLITCITIVFGELVPKRIGQMYPEAVARWVSRPMTTLARIAGPFVKLLSLSTQGVLRLMRINNQRGQEVTEEEITASLAEGVSAGLIEEHEHQMVRNVFRLDERTVGSMMVPRGDIQWLEASLTSDQALAQLRASPSQDSHSWYPVCRQGLAHVVGMISTAQLLALSDSDAHEPLERHARPALFVPETLSAMELLEQLRDQSGRMLLVVYEYGEVQGLLTPLDLLQAITGELKPEVQTEAWATQREDGSWLLDGLMPISELKARLNLQDLPDEDRGRYNTLAGLLLYQLGRLPQTGERLQIQGWWFEIVDLDGRRIDKVLGQPPKMRPEGVV